jgi:hypothetical protein
VAWLILSQSHWCVIEAIGERIPEKVGLISASLEIPTSANMAERY